MSHGLVTTLLTLKHYGQRSKMHNHSPKREGSHPQGVPLDGVLTQGKSLQLQTLCSEEDLLQVSLWWGSFYTLLESDLWSNTVT